MGRHSTTHSEQLNNSDKKSTIVSISKFFSECRASLKTLFQKEKRAVWNCIREGIATVEGSNVLNGKIIDCNAAMSNLCGGLTPDDLRGTMLHQHLGSQSKERLADWQSQWFSSGELEFELAAGPGGGVKHCEATIMRMPADQSSGIQMILVVRDRTLKKEMQQQASAAFSLQSANDVLLGAGN